MFSVSHHLLPPFLHNQPTWKSAVYSFFLTILFTSQPTEILKRLKEHETFGAEESKVRLMSQVQKDLKFNCWRLWTWSKEWRQSVKHFRLHLLPILFLLFSDAWHVCEGPPHILIYFISPSHLNCNIWFCKYSVDQ